MRIAARLRRKWADLQFRGSFAARNLRTSRNVVWTDDRSARFQHIVSDISNNDVGMIFGNAPNLDILENSCIARIGEYDCARIGINRSFLKLPTDVLLWTDSELWPELAPEHIPEGTAVVRIARPYGHPPYIRWWVANRRLDQWPAKGLFFLRNTLVSALHFCQRADIRRIVLFGVSLDSYAHFHTPTEAGEDSVPYEHHGRDYIDRVFHGYDIRRCIQEVLEHLIAEGFDIRYVGESRFLGDLGLKGYPDFPALERDPEMVPFLKKESTNEET